MIASFIAEAIAISTVFLFGSVGEIITEKSGHLNLGIPGIMCMGTVGGCWGLSLYVNSLADPTNPNYIIIFLVSIIPAFIFGALGSLIYAFLTVTMRCNQNVTGLALTTFGAGFAQFFMEGYVNRTYFASACKIISKGLPFADKLGWFGQIFLSHGIFVYMAIIFALIAGFLLRKSRIGLNLRAVGEDPAAADAAGINVTAYKYGAILIGGGISGFGGLFYTLDFIKGSWENASTIVAMGWIVIALVIFALWKPDLGILGSIVFGALYLVSKGKLLNGLSFSVTKLFGMTPYLVTIVVLIITSIRDSKENQPPASLGLNYFREDR